MIDSGLVFTFTRAAPGRETIGLESFTESMAFFATAAHEGKCEMPINFMGNSGKSFILIPGEYLALNELVRSDEFRELYTKVVFAVPDVAYEIGAFGQGVQDMMARWTRVGTEMAIL